ncbi:MAG TPA: FxsA family protein [Alphaproteobacteria bacterium]|nr:FxsA family protein [Alphaproteobacteria bacterium]
MARILFLVFLFVPLAEIACFVVIGNAIGLWPTLLGVLVTSVAGSLVLRHQGRALIGQIRDTVARGILPARALADAMMIGIAGALLLTPGYCTDLIGFLLFIPPVRTALYAFLRRRLAVASTAGVSAAGARRPPSPGTIDLEQGDWRRR